MLRKPVERHEYRDKAKLESWHLGETIEWRSIILCMNVALLYDWEDICVERLQFGRQGKKTMMIEQQWTWTDMVV